MNACVFAGPTLPPRDSARAFDGIWLPPAKHGDIYRAVALLRPRAIGLVDGYFQWVPSVRHQEILWAIDRGVHVFGSASMGALRAAELAAFGMRGVGRIFQAYCSGKLDESGDEPFEDDDEVAVIHGPAESGYLAASEAMVNIRCTLAVAQGACVIGAATRSRLTRIAKSLYFPERSYLRLLEEARTANVSAIELAALEAWLPEARVNQKRADAVAMLDAMRSFLAQEPAPANAKFQFEYTTIWRRGFAAVRTAVHDEDETAVLAELRLQAGSGRALRSAALHGCMAAPSQDDGTEGAALAGRLAEHRDDPDEIESILEAAERTQAMQRVAHDVPGVLVERQVLARLRATDEYGRLAARARDKRARLASRTDPPHAGDLSGPELLQLQDWFFSRVQGDDIPDDLEGYLRDSGFAGEPDFHDALLGEYLYRQMTDCAHAGPDDTLGHAGALQR